MRRNRVFNFVMIVAIMIAIAIPSYGLAVSYPARSGLVEPENVSMNLNEAKTYTNNTPQLAPSKFKPIFNIVSGLLLYGSIAIAIVWGGLLGIRFIVGTIDDKATVKDNLIPYLIGLMVSFGAYGIWTAVINVLK